VAKRYLEAKSAKRQKQRRLENLDYLNDKHFLLAWREAGITAARLLTRDGGCSKRLL